MHVDELTAGRLFAMDRHRVLARFQNGTLFVRDRDDDILRLKSLELRNLCTVDVDLSVFVMMHQQSGLRGNRV